MLLDNNNREEALEVLNYLEVTFNLKFAGCTDEGFWTHKFTRFLGGRDGWSGLYIDRGPDFELDDDYSPETIVVDGVEYRIAESD